MKIKRILVSFLILITIWFLYNNTLDITVFVIGIVLSLLTSLIFCQSCNVFNEFKFTPRAFLYSVKFIFIFLIELIKSNLDVARRVLTPSLPINPGIVEVKTKLTSKMARMLLANSITLTPGTLTIEIIDDSLFIHWIDVKDDEVEVATKEIVSKFENCLIKIYD